MNLIHFHQHHKLKEETFMGTILVTSATGNIGQQVVRQLSDAGFTVRAAVHSLKKIDPLKDTHAECVEIDYSKPETFQNAFRGIEKLFMVLPLLPTLADIGAKLVQEAQDAGVKYIISSSAMGADSEPGITLGRWHREVEKKVQTSGIPYTILRPNSFMQNYSTMYGQTLKSNNAFYLPLGDGKVSLVDTRDIASVAVAVFSNSGHEGKAYNVTGPEALSNFEIAEIFSKVLERKINYVSVSENDARGAMKEKGMPQWLIDAVTELFQIQKAGYGAEVAPTVQNITGKQPRTFEQFLKDHISAFM
jgi:uncharacterized protein YbjT (DUF2867 family)